MSICENEPDFLILLHDVARLMRLELDRRARLHDMNRAQWVMIIKLVRNPGLSQKDLAELLEVEPMTVARLTDRLEARGLVERRPDPRDRRIWRLHVTSKTHPMIDEIESERAAVAAMVTRDLTPQQTATMVAGLLLMKSSLGAGDRAGDDHIANLASAEQEIA